MAPTTLVSMVIAYFIPFLFMFAAMTRGSASRQA